MLGSREFPRGLVRELIESLVGFDELETQRSRGKNLDSTNLPKKIHDLVSSPPTIFYLF